MAPKKKEKAVKMSLHEFMADNTFGSVPGGSWADTEIEPAFTQNMSSPSWSMGSRPEAFSGARAEREGYTREAVPIPDEPPFTARVTNLDYNLEDGVLERELFDESYGIVSARYPRDATGKFRGYVFVEFATKEALERSLKLDGTPFTGRQLRVSVAERRQDDVRFGGNWRAGNRGPLAPLERGGGGRGGDMGGPPPFDDRNYDSWERKGPLPSFQSERGPRRPAPLDDRNYDQWERKGPMPGHESRPPRERRIPDDDRDYSSWERKGPLPAPSRSNHDGVPRHKPQGTAPEDDRDYSNWERKGPIVPPSAPARKPFTERKKSHNDEEDQKSFDNWRAGKVISGHAPRAHPRPQGAGPRSSTHGAAPQQAEAKEVSDKSDKSKQVESLSKRFDVLRTNDDENDEPEETPVEKKVAPVVADKAEPSLLALEAEAAEASSGDWSTPQRRTRAPRPN